MNTKYLFVNVMNIKSLFQTLVQMFGANITRYCVWQRNKELHKGYQTFEGDINRRVAF